MRQIETPLHPEAMHKHSLINSTSKGGWDVTGRHYKVHICTCGAAFFFEPDLYSAL